MNELSTPEGIPSYEEFVAKYGSRPKDIIYNMALKLARDFYETQLTKVHNLDGPELREKVKDKLETYGCPDSYLENEIEFWLALIPNEEETRKELEVLRGQIKELSKTLDDREQDLIEAKREERERIAELLLASAQLSADFPSFHANVVSWACQALKEVKK